MEVFGIIAILWSLPWKGVALWKSSRNDQKGWFVALLIIQTLGILEIIYLIGFQKDRNPKGMAGNKPPSGSGVFSSRGESF